MTGLLGYNFLSDVNSIDPTITIINNLTITAVMNGIFDHLYITRNVTEEYNTTKPEDWDFDTIIDVDFDGNISGGNIGEVAGNITAVRIKRRELGEFEWTTIREIQINDPSELTFIINDYLNLNDRTYEYAFVPIMEGTEGEYIIDQVFSEFRGVFICDVDDIFKHYFQVQYGNSTRNQSVGVYQTFNRQYPTIITNAALNYLTGSLSGKIMPEDFLDNRTVDREQIRIRTNLLLNFLTNKKPKLIKDWNGNAWLCYITGNPSVTYDNNYGMGVTTVDTAWTEIGNPTNKSDLYAAGMIPTEE